jgi:hypothetical protein
MTIIEAARFLYLAELGGIYPRSVIRYFDIVARFREYRKTYKYTESLERTGEDCFCSPELVQYAERWYKKHIDKQTV